MILPRFFYSHFVNIHKVSFVIRLIFNHIKKEKR